MLNQMEIVFKLIHTIKRKILMLSGLEITEDGTIKEDSEVANRNKEVVEEEDINPEEDLTT